jgi:EmrB/QacA subfamily drug resistance transporter
MQPIHVIRNALVAGSAERSPAVLWALASLALSMLLSSLGTSIANVGLPTLAQAFSASFQEVQWVVLAYLLAITTLIVGVGRVGDIIGRRRLLLAGIVLFSVASLLCGVASTLGQLLAARAAQGCGAAIMIALSMAMVGEAVPQARTGSAMGLLGTMSAIGTALGPSLGGVLIAGCGWRAIFLVNVPLGLLTFLLARRHLPVDRRGPQTERAGFDTLGMLLLALTLAAYALAMTMALSHFGPLNITLLLAAAIGAGFFVRVEARATAPLIDLAIFRDPGLRAGLAMNALVATVIMTTLVVGPFHLARALGLDAPFVGLAMSAGPLAAALSGVPAGRSVDRFGAPRMTIVGLIGVAAGSCMLSVLPTRLGISGYPRPDDRHHRQLCPVPDRQQQRRDGRHPPGAARRHFRDARPGAQSRADHRRLRAGRGVCARGSHPRHRHGASRGHCPRHADHLRRRGAAGRHSAHHRCGQSCCRNTPCAR